ncbi:hypothetical protein NDU88_005433 [Pleurodeles waltl]|uniref:Uncharacterized protein n=1 Tax=Pleurodeles waltl TaxID=8319 RepID=A0AAV7TUT2_PLEWA|nr:hypothetical protein NDU88_005433 [Pleurodeles waltl]
MPEARRYLQHLLTVARDSAESLSPVCAKWARPGALWRAESGRGAEPLQSTRAGGDGSLRNHCRGRTGRGRGAVTKDHFGGR